MANNIDKDLREYYIEQEMKYIFQMDFQTDLFSDITFPTLPQRFPVFMSELEFPEKAKSNPSGSLMMNPLQMNTTDSNDKAKQLFNSKLFKNNQVGLKNTLNPDAYIQESFYGQNSISLAEWFYHGFVLNQLCEDTANGVGSEIPVRDIKERTEKFVKANTDVQKAITTYITSSISIIQPLLEIVRGSQAGSYSTNIKKSINQVNRLSVENIQDWLNTSIDNNVLGDAKSSQIQKLKKRGDNREKASRFLSAILLNLKDEDKQYANSIMGELSQIEDEESAVNDLIKRYQHTWKNWNDFDKNWKADDPKKSKFKVFIPSNIKSDKNKQVNDSLKNTGHNILNEEQDNTRYDHRLNYDKIYNDMKAKLSQDMSDCISARSEWMFIKGMEEAMNKLKEKTSELVVKRIHHVCKTKESDRKSLVTWPLKANGIL